MSLSSKLRVSKDEVVAENGVVAANHALSSEAGVEMLKAGGNAVDAAVATGVVACVVEPMMTSIGGVRVHADSPGGGGEVDGDRIQPPGPERGDPRHVHGDGVGDYGHRAAERSQQ